MPLGRKGSPSTSPRPSPTPGGHVASAPDPATDGTASPPPNGRSSSSPPTDSPTRRSPNGYSWPEAPSNRTSNTFSPRPASATGLSWPRPSANASTDQPTWAGIVATPETNPAQILGPGLRCERASASERAATDGLRGRGTL